MSDHAATRPRRPPPPPPALPVRPPPPPAPPAARRPLESAAMREWRPQPWPTLMQDAVSRIEGYDIVEPDRREALLNRQASWSGVLIWGFGVIVLLLVVAPMSAIPKLLGPFSTPVSGAAFGPIIALFAVMSIAVAVGGGLWLWIAMGRDYQPDERSRPPVI
jgi:hypothetical protein